jgi:hypothetical protein
MVEPASPRFRRRLVGQPLLYAISIFASLGVFLVSEQRLWHYVLLLNQRYTFFFSQKFGYDQGCAYARVLRLACADI